MPSAWVVLGGVRMRYACRAGGSGVDRPPTLNHGLLTLPAQQSSSPDGYLQGAPIRPVMEPRIKKTCTLTTTVALNSSLRRRHAAAHNISHSTQSQSNATKPIPCLRNFKSLPSLPYASSMYQLAVLPKRGALCSPARSARLESQHTSRPTQRSGAERKF